MVWGYLRGKYPKVVFVECLLMSGWGVATISTLVVPAELRIFLYPAQFLLMGLFLGRLWARLEITGTAAPSLDPSSTRWGVYRSLHARS